MQKKSIIKGLVTGLIRWPLINDLVVGFCKGSQPVFIVGCGHSGTSVTLAMLGNHPNLHAVPFESALMYSKTPEELYYKSLLWSWKAFIKGKKRWVEKTPKHVQKLDQIFSTFPKAKIILMIRDGRDVVCSLRKRTGEFESSIDRWLTDNLAAKKYWEHSSVKMVRLEDLVKTPVEILNELCQFLQEPPEVDKMLKYYEADQSYYDPKKGDHSTLRKWQLKQRLFKNTSRWQTEISVDELKQLVEKVGPLMRELNYQVD